MAITGLQTLAVHLSYVAQQFIPHNSGENCKTFMIIHIQLPRHYTMHHRCGLYNVLERFFGVQDGVRSFQDSGELVSLYMYPCFF